MSYDNANKVDNEPFESLFLRYQTVNFKLGGSQIYSPDRIKKKKTTINPTNTDDKLFQYVVTVTLNYEDIESHPERVSNIKPFINTYNRKEINYPSIIDDWKTFERSNLTIALNICILKKKEFTLITSQNVTQPVKNKQFY